MKFAPKKTKFRKAHKGRIHNLNANRGIHLDKGRYGLISLEAGRIDGNQLESARVTLNRKIKKVGYMWIRIFPNVPVTKKPLEMRMGQGKGPVDRWIFRVKPQRILFELSNSVPFSIAIKALKSVAYKLPVKTAIIYTQE